MRDLEGRTEDSWAFLYGPIGPPARDMDWEDMVLWFETLDMPEDVLEFQRENMYEGQDFSDLLEYSFSDNQATKKVGSFHPET